MKHDLEYTDREKMDAELKKITKKVNFFSVFAKITALLVGVTGVMSIVAMCGLMASAGLAIGTYVFAGASLAGFLGSFAAGAALLTKEEELKHKIDMITKQNELTEVATFDYIKSQEDVKTANEEKLLKEDRKQDLIADYEQKEEKFYE